MENMYGINQIRTFMPVLRYQPGEKYSTMNSFQVRLTKPKKTGEDISIVNYTRKGNRFFGKVVNGKKIKSPSFSTNLTIDDITYQLFEKHGYLVALEKINNNVVRL